MAVTFVRIEDQGEAGPIPARNAALRSAPTEWVLLLDADARPAPGCAEALLAAVRPDAAIVVPRVLRDGKVQYDGGSAHFLGELCLDNAATAAASTALLVHRDRVAFDEDLRFFREDLDLCVSARARGWTIVRCPEARVTHEPGRRGPLHRRRTFFQTRNRWWIVLKTLEARTLLLTLPLQLAYEALILGQALRKGDLAQYARAFVDLARHAPALLRSRRTFQSRRTVPDRRLYGAPPLTWRERSRLSSRVDAVAAAWWRLV